MFSYFSTKSVDKVNFVITILILFSMEDSFRHKGLRKKLIELIRSKGISDENVLTAMNKVPRHLFMDSSFINFSYSDQAFPIGSGQTISQPYTVAFQSSLLGIKPLEKVLEVGTGSGYQAAVLLEMGAKVYTIERQRDLFLKSQPALNALGYKPHFFYGDGYEGIPSYQPFDKILVTAAAPVIPEKLLAQLKIGGILVIPVGGDAGQSMVKIVRESENNFVRTEHGAFAFVPLLKGKAG
jgi:protein-L-isoaspartate(D-aspartate) O-methyltransferase